MSRPLIGSMLSLFVGVTMLLTPQEIQHNWQANEKEPAHDGNQNRRCFCINSHHVPGKITSGTTDLVWKPDECQGKQQRYRALQPSRSAINDGKGRIGDCNQNAQNFSDCDSHDERGYATNDQYSDRRWDALRLQQSR